MLNSILLLIITLLTILDVYLILLNRKMPKRRDSGLLYRMVGERVLLIFGLWFWVFIMLEALGFMEIITFVTVVLFAYLMLQIVFPDSGKNPIGTGFMKVLANVSSLLFFLVAFTLFFLIMEPLTLFISSGLFLWLVFMFYGRSHGRFIRKRFRLVPFDHGIEDDLFGGTSIKESVYMIDSEKIRLGPNAMLLDAGNRKQLFISRKLIVRLRSAHLAGIMAHEVGHAVRKHILIRAAAFLLCVIVFFVLNIFLVRTGVYPESLVGLYTTAFLFNYALMRFLKFLILRILHQQEYEADRFAVKKGYGASLKHGLQGIAVYVNDDEFHQRFAYFHRSHPTIRTRIKAIDRQMGK